MNYKSLMFIALALCLCFAVAPVAAVWDNGNWVSPDTLVGYNVVHDSTTGVDSKYRDITPTVQGQDGMSAYGGKVYGNVRAGYSTLSPTVAVTNDLAPDAAPMLVDVSPDGTFEIPAWNNGVLSPGNYTATLDNFNLPDETVHFPIVADQKTQITFIGQATSGLPKVEATPTICPSHDCKGKFVFVNIFGIIKMNNELQHGRTFNFDNRPNPGGLWSSNGNLIQQIADPDYGVVKDVFILYSHKAKVNGHWKITFHVGSYEEYQNIPLTSQDTVIAAVYGERTCAGENQPPLPS